MPAVIDDSKIDFYIATGKEDRYWYRDTAKNLRKFFPKHNFSVVVDLLCATSINTSLKANVGQFFKALYQYNNQLPFEGYMPNIIFQLEHVRAGRDLSGRKINSFSRALKGDKNAVVVDIWLQRAYGVNTKRLYKGKQYNLSPTDGLYTKIENAVILKAKELNLQPRECSSMIWSGVRQQSFARETTRWDDEIRKRLKTTLFESEKGYTKTGAYV